MATVVVTHTSAADLDKLIEKHRLPTTTRERVRGSLSRLASFPLIGPALEGNWLGYRFLLGPWPWMLIVYIYDGAADQVAIVTVQDARSEASARTPR